MLEKIKEHFLASVAKADSKYSYLLHHLPHVEKWANKLLKKFPKANKEVVLMGVWLHDIGQVIGDKEADHAVNSEAEAKRFLSEIKLDSEKMKEVMHCVRAHRCRDVQPETLEAKILAASDSASHMTDIVFIEMASRGDIGEARAKLERDYRDVELLSGLKEEVTPLYQAWKKLLEVYPQ